MKVEVYCDESCPDLLIRQPSKSRYMVIGAIRLPADKRDIVKAQVGELREQFACNGEFKWGRVSKNKIGFYLSVIELFAKWSFLQYRCVAVDASKVNMALYHNDDPELCFYKFYYQVFNHHLESNNSYTFYFDEKTTHDRTRLKELRRILGTISIADIEGIHQVNSATSTLIQMADLLTGCVQAKFNGSASGRSLSDPKAAVLRRLETVLGHAIAPTGPAEMKFNVFRMDLH